MSITLLRWKAGSAGDTVLKLLLQSNPDLCSQNQYLNQNHTGKTEIDLDFVNNFAYDAVAKMSLIDFALVDYQRIEQQLCELDQAYPNTRWLLKTHCYYDFSYPVIDIVVEPELVAFAVKASLTKNSRQCNMIRYQHRLLDQIKDPEVLYKFDCFNMASDILSAKTSSHTLSLAHVLSGWQGFCNAVQNLGFDVNADCESEYQRWRTLNEKFIPSKQYQELVRAKNFDCQAQGLSLEERYCLLAMSQQRFRILS
jgi:hypothetical protein